MRDDLRLDPEAAFPKRQRAEELRSHRLVAGHDVRERAAVEDVRRGGDALVPESVAQLAGGVHREAARAEDAVGVAFEERRQQQREVGRVELEVGVDDDGEAAARRGQPRADGAALALVPLVQQHAHPARPAARGEQLTRSVRGAVVDDEQLDRIDGELDRQHLLDRLHDRRPLVEGGHDECEIGEAVRSHFCHLHRQPSRPDLPHFGGGGSPAAG